MNFNYGSELSESLKSNHSLIPIDSNVEIEVLDLGDSKGKPALYFHGWPSASIEAWPLHEAAKKHGLRLIAFNRPGYGRSTAIRQSAFATCAEYVELLVQRLMLDSIHLIAMSGGTPFALASAAKMGKKVDGIHVVSGLGPAHESDVLKSLNPGIRFLLSIGKKTPYLGRLALACAGLVVRSFPGIPESIIRFDPHLCASDRDVLTASQLKGLMNGIASKAFQQGSLGPWQDGLLYCQPWNIPFEKMTSRCSFWHGTSDGVTSVYMIQKLVRQIPDAELVVFKGDGHFSTPWAHSDALVQSVMNQD